MEIPYRHVIHYLEHISSYAYAVFTLFYRIFYLLGASGWCEKQRLIKCVASHAVTFIQRFYLQPNMDLSKAYYSITVDMILPSVFPYSYWISYEVSDSQTQCKRTFNPVLCRVWLQSDLKFLIRIPFYIYKYVYRGKTYELCRAKKSILIFGEWFKTVSRWYVSLRNLKVRNSSLYHSLTELPCSFFSKNYS